MLNKTQLSYDELAALRIRRCRVMKIIISAVIGLFAVLGLTGSVLFGLLISPIEATKKLKTHFIRLIVHRL